MSYLKEHDAHGAYPATVFYMANTDGEIQIEECDACGYWNVVCLHMANTWYDVYGNPLPGVLPGVLAGVTLLCDLCGADGT